MPVLPTRYHFGQVWGGIAGTLLDRCQTGHRVRRGVRFDSRRCAHHNVPSCEKQNRHMRVLPAENCLAEDEERQTDVDRGDQLGRPGDLRPEGTPHAFRRLPEGEGAESSREEGDAMTFSIGQIGTAGGGIVVVLFLLLPWIMALWIVIGGSIITYAIKL